jgi:hypothetical protein
MQIAKRLVNGNTLINTWFNQWNGTADPATAPVQALEVTPSKKVVWALRAWGFPWILVLQPPFSYSINRVPERCISVI